EKTMRKLSRFQVWTILPVNASTPQNDEMNRAASAPTYTMRNAASGGARRPVAFVHGHRQKAAERRRRARLTGGAGWESALAPTAKGQAVTFGQARRQAVLAWHWL